MRSKDHGGAYAFGVYPEKRDATAVQYLSICHMIHVQVLRKTTFGHRSRNTVHL